jgi:hypothetical protein
MVCRFTPYLYSKLRISIMIYNSSGDDMINNLSCDDTNGYANVENRREIRIGVL